MIPIEAIEVAGTYVFNGGVKHLSPCPFSFNIHKILSFTFRK